ncbi:hypothetical protein BVX95_01310 [archaeon D22]|nr:hypothetical protein BVX95_01310 [archaeon D22]
MLSLIRKFKKNRRKKENLKKIKRIGIHFSLTFLLFFAVLFFVALKLNSFLGAIVSSLIFSMPLLLGIILTNCYENKIIKKYRKPYTFFVWLIFSNLIPIIIFVQTFGLSDITNYGVVAAANIGILSTFVFLINYAYFIYANN